jgi:hypothetical protein
MPLLALTRRPVLAGVVAGLALMGAGCASSTAQGGGGPRTSVTSASTQPVAVKHHHHRGHQHHHRKAKRDRLFQVPAVDMPNHNLTPGVALHVSAAQICAPGYASRTRDVPQSEKDAVYARYGVAYVPYAHEVDHLVSLEIGGSNVITNLWPEPYAGRWGARTKDVLENRLHELVCDGHLSLQAAQHQEATNWVAAYERYVGGTPSAPSGGSNGGSSGGSGSPQSSGGFYASSYPSASTIYCADDSEWRSLSKTYLVHFSTWAKAHARFPTYHLHQPC